MKKGIKGGLAVLSPDYLVAWLCWLHNQCTNDWCHASGSVSQLAAQG